MKNSYSQSLTQNTISDDDPRKDESCVLCGVAWGRRIFFFVRYKGKEHGPYCRKCLKAFPELLDLWMNQAGKHIMPSGKTLAECCGVRNKTEG